VASLADRVSKPVSSLSSQDGRPFSPLFFHVEIDGNGLFSSFFSGSPTRCLGLAGSSVRHRYRQEYEAFPVISSSPFFLPRGQLKELRFSSFLPFFDSPGVVLETDLLIRVVIPSLFGNDVIFSPLPSQRSEGREPSLFLGLPAKRRYPFS